MGKLYCNTKVYIYDVSINWRRDKTYTRREITSEVQQPVLFTDRADSALDSASIVLLNKDKKRIQPFTRVYFDITSGEVEGSSINTQKYYCVVRDVVNQVVYSSDPTKRIYKHQIELVENTKWLERFDVDNTTVTNMLMFLYNESGIAYTEAQPNVSYTGRSHITFYSSQYTGWQYSDNTHRFTTTVLDSTPTIDCKARVVPQVVFYAFGIPSYQAATITKFKVKLPNGTILDLATNRATYTLTSLGFYTFIQTYRTMKYGMYYEFTFSWTVQYIHDEGVVKQPERFTIAQVVDKVLSQVTRENTIRRESDTPLFQLDENQREQLQKMIAPEFTFTQSTLYGILSEIGSSIHAIPRLNVLTQPITENGVTENVPTEWNVIHFDFLSTVGNNKSEPDYPDITVSMEETQGSDNYATAMVSNVQNAFISTNRNYASITEPFSKGYISTRTEQSDYEVSNDHCVIKVSRPIQRICELWCLYDKDYPAIDIAPYCKEKADYSLLTDYQFTNSNYFGQGTKQTNIYYTRGDNVIRGLDYISPSAITFIPNLDAGVNAKLQTIKYLLILALESQRIAPATAVARIKDLKLRDICFRIKYVPYLNFKTKQFRENITEDMETSNLYYNQDAQVVDCNAFGERIKGALNMTSNEEPTFTYITKTPDFVKRTGQLVNFGGGYGQYFAYEKSVELTKKCCTTTIKYSKNFNKWNEYIAVKKNYRQYEISENESVEQTPIYNQFIIVDTKADFDKAPVVDPDDDLYTDAQTDMVRYADEINSQEAFIEQANVLMTNFLGYIVSENDAENAKISYMLMKTTGKEWDGQNLEYVDVTNEFMLPTSVFYVGNSAIVNVSTKDNYSAGTTVELNDENDSYGLEKDIKYGTKYGNFDKVQVVFGDIEFDYAIQHNLPSQNQMTRGRQLYKLNNPITKNQSRYKIWDDALMINKDSRQKINLTLQLNAVSGSDEIWIGSSFIERFGLSEQRVLDQTYFVWVYEMPDRFLSKSVAHSALEGAMISPYSCTRYGLNRNMKTWKWNIHGVEAAPQDAVGVALIDINDNILLYYNCPVKAGQTPENNIYLQFRERI